MCSRILTAVVSAILFSIPLTASAAVLTFVVPLSGAQEVDATGNPNQGDPDGIGTATLMINDATNEIDWEFSVSNITLPLSLAHIHEAPAGINGLVRVDFNAQLAGTNLLDADLASVLANPTGFYVNLHNADFPAGALRGQLPASPVPAPPALVLLGTAMGAALLRRGRPEAQAAAGGGASKNAMS